MSEVASVRDPRIQPKRIKQRRGHRVSPKYFPRTHTTDKLGSCRHNALVRGYLFDDGRRPDERGHVASLSPLTPKTHRHARPPACEAALAAIPRDKQSAAHNFAAQPVHRCTQTRSEPSGIVPQGAEYHRTVTRGNNLEQTRLPQI